MLRVFRTSGEEALAIEFANFVTAVDVGEQPIRISDLKRYLQGICGQPRFRQRLLLSDGQILPDDATLDGAMDLQLILMPFSPSGRPQELWDAAGQNDVVTVENLLQRPQDPDVEFVGATPLLIAAARGSMEAVRLLLEAKADKDKPEALTGVSPIYIASCYGHASVVRLLLDVKADMEKLSSQAGESPMYAAADRGQTEVVRLLLEARADKETANKHGQNPLQAASREGHEEIVHLLLEAAPDKSSAKRNNTAWYYNPE